MSEHALTWGETASNDDKLWGALAHLSVFVGGFIGPLVVLLVFQEKSKFIRYHAIQALAVQVGVVIAAILVSIISFVTCGVGAVLYLPLMFVFLLPLWGAWIGWNGQWEGFPGIATFGR